MERSKYISMVPDTFSSVQAGKTTRSFHLLVSLGAVALAVFQLLQAVVTTHSSIDLNIIHVLATALLVVLASISKSLSAPHFRVSKVFFPVFIAFLIMATASYLWARSIHLEVDWPWISDLDIIVGISLFFGVSVATWFAWGPLLSLIGVAGILYFIFGNYLPGLLGHSGVSLAYAVSYLGMSLKTGMFWLIPLSITVIFPLMVFGLVMRASGATEAFGEFMKLAGRVSKVAPVYTCVVESGLVGMVTAAPNANVVLTGCVTIPAMKKIGLRPETAGGLESLSSTGSQLVPPIMGLAAFVMAQLIGVSYIQVMVAAILPSALYYGALVISAYFVTVNDLAGTKGKLQEKVDWVKIFKLLPTFFIPLGIIVYFLFSGYSPLYASIWSTIAVIVLSQTQGRFRPSLFSLAKGFSEGAVLGSEIAVILMSVGFLGQSLMSTGLALRLSQVFTTIIGGSFALSLVVLMIVSLAIGMGAPTIVAYVLCAIAVVPAVQDLGVGLLAAHFFAFYFATFSHITPPVAGAVVTACQLAKSKYTTTALQAVRLAWPLFLVPFLFVGHWEFLEPSKLSWESFLITSIYFITVINGASSVWNGLPGIRIGFACRGVLVVATVAGVICIFTDHILYEALFLVATLVGWGVPCLRTFASRMSKSPDKEYSK
jgi:TRAP transporter 4TM/12TM fusion protein